MVGDGMNVEELRNTNNSWRVSATKRAENYPCIRARELKRMLCSANCENGGSVPEGTWMSLVPSPF